MLVCVGDVLRELASTENRRENLDRFRSCDRQWLLLSFVLLLALVHSSFDNTLFFFSSVDFFVKNGKSNDWNPTALDS